MTDCTPEEWEARGRRVDIDGDQVFVVDLPAAEP